MSSARSKTAFGSEKLTGNINLRVSFLLKGLVLGVNAMANEPIVQGADCRFFAMTAPELRNRGRPVMTCYKQAGLCGIMADIFLYLAGSDVEGRARTERSRQSLIRGRQQYGR